MNEDICMILAFDRPEFLYLCLQHVTTNQECKDLFFLFVLDYKYRRKVKDIAWEWLGTNKFRGEIFEVPKGVQGRGKQSHAMISGYREAKALSNRFVYMIEEDLLVSDRFIEWHRKVQARENIFCSIGTRNNNTIVPESRYEDYYVVRGKDYQSLGVCWNRDNLDLLLEHGNKHYFKDPVGYCRENFPDSKINPLHSEQDGVVRRVIEKGNLAVAFPTIGFSYHAGWYGYNRKKRGIGGALTKKIEKVRAVVYSKEQMRVHTASQAEYNDSIPCKLNIGSEWSGELNKIEI